jgi:hypothetical protein
MRQKRRGLYERAKAPDAHDFRAKIGLLAPNNTQAPGNKFSA